MAVEQNWGALFYIYFVRARTLENERTDKYWFKVMATAPLKRRATDLGMHVPL